MRLTRRTLLAVEAALDIACNSAAGPVSSAAIAARQNVPRRYLEQVLQDLAQARVLRGVRGPRGGYTLARERRNISVEEIVRVAGRDQLLSAASESALGRAALGPFWRRLEDAMAREMRATTLDDLTRAARAAGAAPSAPAADFAI